MGRRETLDEAVEDHDGKLERLLERAAAQSLKLNAEKFVHRKAEVKFAGYILTDQGHKLDPAKISAITNMSAPTDVAGVRRFLGMVNFLGKFLEDLSSVCEPLRNLTKDNVLFNWSHEQEEAFRKTKEALSKAPVLAFFDERQQTVLQCDALKSALGAVLLQNDRSIAYASRVLTPAETNYAQIEKELLAVLFGMEHFDQYTYGRSVIVHSDHKPLQVILKKAIMDAPQRLQRMLLRFQRYDISLVYRPRCEIVVADMLSRAPDSTQIENHQKDLETICSVVEAETTDVMLKELQQKRQPMKF